MSDFKVSVELRDFIIKYIYEARWYIKSDAHGYIDDAEEMVMENGDKVADSIVGEVVSFLSTKDIQTMQLKRIADSLEKISDATNYGDGYITVHKAG